MRCAFATGRHTGPPVTSKDGRVPAYTVVSFHAHPDDEALLTAGTLARASAEGHRVVIVSATDGARGLVAHGLAAGLADRRRAELRAAAAAIGCSDVRFLGYGDSGLAGPEAPSPGPGPGPRPECERERDTPPFATADVEQAAGRLAAILTEVGADALTIYDPAGGYGHPDHVQVHRVGQLAAALASTPIVLEATVDRRPLVRVLRVLTATRLLGLLGVNQEEWSAPRFAAAYADPARITHRVDSRRYAARKRAAMAAHASQATADEGVRTLAVFVRLPRPVFALLFGREWFVEQGRMPPGRPLDDIFATLRNSRFGSGGPRPTG